MKQERTEKIDTSKYKKQDQIYVRDKISQNSANLIPYFWRSHTQSLMLIEII